MTKLEVTLTAIVGKNVNQTTISKLAGMGVDKLTSMSLEEYLNIPGVDKATAIRIVSAFGIVPPNKRCELNSRRKLINSFTALLGKNVESSTMAYLVDLGFKKLSTMSMEEMKQIPGVDHTMYIRIVSAFGSSPRKVWAV